MAQSLAAIMADLNAQYDPSRALIAKQQADLPGQETAAVAGLDAAKTNAFDTVRNNANAQGMLYSGTPINEQNKYIGATYMPALAGVKQNTQTQGYKLQEALLGVNQNQAERAGNTLLTQQKNDAAAEADRQQLALKREEMASAQRVAYARSSASKAPSLAQSQASAKTQLNQDLAAAFNGFGGRPNGYTEKVILSQLLAAYPELDPKTITASTYAYRKAIGFN